MDLSEMNIRELSDLKEKIEKEMRKKHEETHLEKDSLMICSKLRDMFGKLLLKKGFSRDAALNICSRLKSSVLFICDITFGNYKKLNDGKRLYCYPNLWDVNGDTYKNMAEDILSIITKYSPENVIYDPLIDEDHKKWICKYNEEIKSLLKEEK